MSNTRAHATRRRVFARAFSKSFLRQHWEPIIHATIRDAVARIKQDAQSGSSDILKWWTFMATDISSQTMFGESLHMTRTGQVTEYVRVLQGALTSAGIGVELPWIRAIAKYIPSRRGRELFNPSGILLKYGKVAVKNSRNLQDGNTIFANVLAEAEKGEHLDDLDVQLEATGLTEAGQTQ